jgi:hypothetical protein
LRGGWDSLFVGRGLYGTWLDGRNRPSVTSTLGLSVLSGGTVDRGVRVGGAGGTGCELASSTMTESIEPSVGQVTAIVVVPVRTGFSEAQAQPSHVWMFSWNLRTSCRYGSGGGVIPPGRLDGSSPEEKVSTIPS